MKGKLILIDGTVFKGDFLFPVEDFVGEVVFNTSMSGYQEVFTDPSYAGQIIAMTYPQIGNYGVFKNQSESNNFPLKGIIIHELYKGPVHPKAEMSLETFLRVNKIPTMENVDTRSLTKHIRSFGTLPGIFTNKDLSKNETERLFTHFSIKNVVQENSTRSKLKSNNQGSSNLVLIDFGYKKSIYQELIKRHASVTIVPFNTSFEAIKDLNPDGIVLSNGPGNPQDLTEILPTIKKLINHYPTFGICLGHQLIALAEGASTFKMNFGHRGGNHSVKDAKTGKVFLSSQNHSYAVDEKTLSHTYLRPRFINVNDKSIEGLEHISKPVLSVQFHPEANAGPEDSSYLFDEFFELMNGGLSHA